MKPKEPPRAVWSGSIMGVRVHVLDDGRRIIDAEDLAQVFERVATGDLDVERFCEEMVKFQRMPIDSPRVDKTTKGAKSDG